MSYYEFKRPPLLLLLNSLVFSCLILAHDINAQPSLAGAVTETSKVFDNWALIGRLNQTNLLNEDEVYGKLKLVGTIPRQTRQNRFITADPYKPRFQVAFESIEDLEYHLPRNARSYELDIGKGLFNFYGQEPVLVWYSSLPQNTEVCAIRFSDDQRRDYELRTFSSREEALAKDFVITHRYHCGTCSSLRNLAVYLAKPDLTTPARSCGRKLTKSSVKRCLMQTIGFERHCAETWTYNVLHTRRQCMTTCLRHYGLWNVLKNNMSQAHVDENGSLNPCLACDEYTSGPGFQYAAGRTRRASGITSAIERAEADIYQVDHGLYFQ
ncbi:MAG: hypothetical protein J4G19_02960 [Pseudomonadales bacterium]|nr:hypothetical protein [Pseudomonadales bacterium]